LKNSFKDLFYSIKTWFKSRYGNDALSITLICFSVAISLTSSYLGEKLGRLISFMAFAVLVFALYRCYSSDIEKRRAENEAFKKLFSAPINSIKLIKRKKNDPEHLYVKCPKCKTVLRVPRGKGRIIITCPNCQNKVEIKS